jgi:hypothetical protein
MSGGNVQEAKPSSEEMDIGTQFMLAEFTNMREMAQQIESASARSTDILIAVISGLAIGITFISQTPIGYRNVLIVSLFAIFSTLLISTVTFLQTVNRDFIATRYIRTINRIRAYFVDHAPHIKPYVLMPTSAKYPAFGKRSRGREITAIINILLASAFIANVSMLMRNTTNLDEITISIMGTSFIIISGLHFGIVIQMTRRAQRRTQEAMEKVKEGML